MFLKGLIVVALGLGVVCGSELGYVQLSSTKSTWMPIGVNQLDVCLVGKSDVSHKSSCLTYSYTDTYRNLLSRLVRSGCGIELPSDFDLDKTLDVDGVQSFIANFCGGASVGETKLFLNLEELLKQEYKNETERRAYIVSRESKISEQHHSVMAEALKAGGFEVNVWLGEVEEKVIIPLGLSLIELVEFLEKKGLSIYYRQWKEKSYVFSFFAGSITGSNYENIFDGNKLTDDAQPDVIMQIIKRYNNDAEIDRLRRYMAKAK